MPSVPVVLLPDIEKPAQSRVTLSAVTLKQVAPLIPALAVSVVDVAMFLPQIDSV
jgi:hypothetical protein